MHPIHHRASLSPLQPLTGVSTATVARRILQDDGVVKGQLRIIYFSCIFSTSTLDIRFPLSDNSTVSRVI